MNKKTMIHLKRLTIFFVLALTMFALCWLTVDIHPQIVGAIVGLIFLWGGMWFGCAFILYVAALIGGKELR